MLHFEDFLKDTAGLKDVASYFLINTDNRNQTSGLFYELYRLSVAFQA